MDEVVGALMLGTLHHCPLQRLYRAVQDVCALQDTAAMQHVYNTSVARLRRLLDAEVDACLKRTPPNNVALHLECMWQSYVAKLARVEQLLAPLLGGAWYAAKVGTSLESVCFAHLQRQLQVLRVEPVLMQSVCAVAQQLREAPHETSLVRSLQSVLRMLRALGLYERVCGMLAAQASAYYTTLAHEFYETDPGAHISAMYACILCEDAWKDWLYGAEAERVLQAMQRTLVSEHVAQLTGLVPLLAEQHAYSTCSMLYHLLARSDVLDALRAALRDYVHERGMALVQGAQDTMMERLVAFQDETRDLWAEGLQHDRTMQHAIRDTFEAVVNARGGKPAELLAQYIDVKLRGGNKIMSDVQLEQCMDNALSLFRHMHDKDMFEEFYKRCFARRLLLSRSASDEAERSMLLKLKREAGPDFTEKLETMLKDMQLSNGLMAAFSDRDTRLPFDFDVHVLTQAHWPTFPDVHVALPPPMMDAMHDYEAFYATVHSGRSLSWRHALGYLVVTVDLGKAGVRELYISTFQAAVLFVFNHAKRGEAIGYETIRAQTQLEPSTLKRTLQSLASGAIPTRVLRKHPQGRDVLESDTFTINEALKNDRKRIRINQIQYKETAEEQRTTEERVFIDRELILQAAVMRILKARKTIAHTELMHAVVQQSKLRFAVDASELKKAFERLIEKDLMERVEGERGVYRYVA